MQFCVWKAVMRTLNGHFLILVVKEMATHSSFLAWEIPWMEEPGGLQPMASQRVGHDWATNTFSFLLFTTNIHGEIREQVGMNKKPKLSFSSVQFIHSVVSDSLRPHGLQHARPPCPSPSPEVSPSSYPLHQGCYPAILSSDPLFSFCQDFFKFLSRSAQRASFLTEKQNCLGRSWT